MMENDWIYGLSDSNDVNNLSDLISIYKLVSWKDESTSGFLDRTYYMDNRSSSVASTCHKTLNRRKTSGFIWNPWKTAATVIAYEAVRLNPGSKTQNRRSPWI